MSEKHALTIAYCILNDKLDTLDEYDAVDDSYYQEVQEAIKVIENMIKAR